MLHSRNLYSVLAQCISQDASADGSIVSSILITLSGQTIASYHSNRPPPPPKNILHTYRFSDEPDDIVVSPSNTVKNKSHLYSDSHADNKNQSIPQNELLNDDQQLSNFQVTRAGKTKVYALFASSAWQQYQQAGMNKIIMTPPAVVPQATPSSDNNSTQRSSSSKSSQNYPDRSREQGYKESRSQTSKSHKLDRNSTNKDSGDREWISFSTETCGDRGATIFILNLKLKESQQELLLILVSDADCPMGMVLKKARETAAVLEEGLSSYTVPQY